MSVGLIDTHCHIHSIGADSDDFTVKKWRDAGIENPDNVIEEANKAEVDRLICVGTDLDDSRRAVDFVKTRENCWASVGVHPHGASQYLHAVSACRTAKQSALRPLSTQHVVDKSSAPSRYSTYRSVRASSSPSAAFEHESIDSEDKVRELVKQPKVVAIGEVGLDYYRGFSPKEDQIRLLEYFLDLAQEKKLPVIFHVRDAHKDFWPIYDKFKGIRGVMHSFSASKSELEKALKRDLLIGLNGIMTFTKDEDQLQVAKIVPLDSLILETDAPYLTPNPYRGTICKPEHTKTIGKFLAELRGESFSDFSTQTRRNSCELFNIA